MDKSPEAFRTISEVADLLETPAHVLRFWESRFPQIRPVKRAGGRRYYRPADVALLSGIKHLLHDEGLTIRGVQKMLREQGVRHVAAICGELHGFEEDAEAALQAALDGNFPEPAAPAPAEPETAQIVALESVARKPARPSQPPVQENLFSDLFDAPPAPAGPTPLFAEVTEALASFDAQPTTPEEVPEAPMASDVDDSDGANAALADSVVALVAAQGEPKAHSDYPPESPDDSAVATALAAQGPATLAQRITAAPRRRLAAHRETLRLLRDRLIVLEDRMIGPRY